MAKITSSKDLIMLLLYAKGHRNKQCEPICTRLRLVKMIFLFQKEVRAKFNLEKSIPDSVFPDFQPYNFGPFADQIYVDLEFLVNLGFVKVKHLQSAEEITEETLEYGYWQANSGISDNADDEWSGIDEFSLTGKGKQFIKKGGLGELTHAQWDGLNKFKARCIEISLRSLLKYVYAKYPKMATNSKIKDKFLK
jgi:uncharacterized protein YwgA